jgi:hypothetical protein
MKPALNKSVGQINHILIPKIRLLPHGLTLTLLSLCLLLTQKASSQLVITNNYLQTFDSLGSGTPTGWATYTAVTSNGLGNPLTFVNTNPATAINTWSNTTGAFKNLASSTGLSQTSNVTAQQSSTDRALGIRPTGTFGDTGTNFASINFNFSTLGYQIESLGLDAMVLATESRTKLWDIQYGIGTSPTSWITLATFTSSTNWITQSYAFTPSDFGTALDNQSSVWFRFASTATSTGTGSRPTIAVDNFSLQVIPEPTTLGLLALGLIAGAIGIAKQRKA